MTLCEDWDCDLTLLPGGTRERMAQVELLCLVSARDGGWLPQLGAAVAGFFGQAAYAGRDASLLAPAYEATRARGDGYLVGKRDVS